MIPPTDITIGEALRWINKLCKLKSQGAQIIHLGHLLKRVMDTEREACAKTAEEHSNIESLEPTGWAIARKIRARSKA